MTNPFRKKVGFVESIGGSAGGDAANRDYGAAFLVGPLTSPGGATSAGSVTMSDPTFVSAGIDRSDGGNFNAAQSGDTATVMTAATVSAAAGFPSNLQNAAVANG